MAAPKGVRIDGFKDGLVNKRPPEEIGLSGLMQAINLDISDKNKLRMRSGFTLQIDDKGHSLWNTQDKKRGFYVSTVDYQMKALSDDLLSGIPLLEVADLRMSFANIGIGIQSMIAFSNGIVIGTIDIDQNITMWNRTGDYARDMIYLDVSQEETHFDTLPPGELLSYGGGVLFSYSRAEKAVFFSKTNKTHLCDTADDFWRLPDVTMIAHVDDGIYISTSERVLYKSGLNPRDASPLIQVSDAPAVFGSGIVTDGAVIGTRGFPGKVAIWESAKGKMIGASGGQVVAATGRRFGGEIGDECASMIMEEGGHLKHVSVMRNPGNNENAFQATDYAEAEIRRNGNIIT